VLAGSRPRRITRRALSHAESDARLVELARAGDHQAFELIIERYRPALVVYCRGIVGDASAQDAVQQASISAWQALRRGQDVRHVRAWLYAIARRAALETLRLQGAATAQLPETMPGSLSPEELIEQSTRARETLAALAELPSRERDALVWTSLHGRSGREAARALGVSEGAIRQLLVRARARARAAIHVLVPPVLVTRLPALHAPRRLASLLRAPGPLASAAGGEGAGWLAPLLAAGVLVAAPVAAVKLAPHDQAAPAHAGTSGTQPAPATARPKERLPSTARRRGSVVRERRATAPAAAIRPRVPVAPGDAKHPSAATADPGSQAPTRRESQQPGSPVSALAGQAPQPAVPAPSLPQAPTAPSVTEAPAVKAVGGVTEGVADTAETTTSAARDLTAGVEGAAEHALEGVHLP
jgi:RNA polymerase sigma factor (sigma-70 family)